MIPGRLKMGEGQAKCGAPETCIGQMTEQLKALEDEDKRDDF